ncbi:MAG: hypothetical protein A2007_03950 [Verrucomicrobia bacterium GWC2_42_7]|nr:MAG: hypothetical protein A2007_03950 [Verrucomicrobia bacterium GWC2_42_7]
MRVILLILFPIILWARDVRVASYNVCNYCACDRFIENKFRENFPKPEAEKKIVQDIICSADPDVIALQEIGTKPYLEELQKDLERKGKKYPFLALMEGEDKVRHLAILSRIPIKSTLCHSDLSFSYFKTQQKLKRGLLEVTFETEGKEWHLFVVHLKSRISENKKDPIATEFRSKEAQAIRDQIKKQTIKNSLFMIAGDFNDTKQSRPLYSLLKINQKEFCKSINTYDSRGETWTYFYARADTYSRTDYLLVSNEMLQLSKDKKGVIADPENATKGSDHRLIYTDFSFPSKK